MKKFAFLLVTALCLSSVYGSSFKIAVLPDTQQYSNNYPSIFTTQTQWIVNNKTSQSIAFVTHLGDVVNNGMSEMYQWTNANNALNILNGQLPYSICIGNHDYDVVGEMNDPFGNGATTFKSYFGSSRYSSYTWYKGASPYGLSHYQIFSAGGRDWLHFNFEYEADNSILMWAQNIIDANPTLPVIISTHSFIGLRTNLEDANDVGFRSASKGGDAANGSLEMWYKFISHNDQIFMVLCGHRYGEECTSLKNDYGNDVYFMLTDYQDWAYGGNGYLRLLEFDDTNNQIKATTYSPKLGTYETDANSQFTLNVDFNARFSSFGTREVINGIQAANIKVTNDPVFEVSILPGQSTSNISIVPEGTNGYTPQNLGDYYIQIGQRCEDDTMGGVLISSIAQNGVDNSFGWKYYHTSASNIWGHGQISVGVQITDVCAPDGAGGMYQYTNLGEGDANVAVAYFPFSQFIGAHCEMQAAAKIYSAAGNGVLFGGNLTQYPNSTDDPTLVVNKVESGRTWNEVDGDRGIFELTIPGVNSVTDGIILANTNDNGDNYITVSPHEDGNGWQIATLDNSGGPGTECSGFSFVYVPYSTPGIIAGRFNHNSASIAAGTGGFKAEPISNGRTRLRIAGCTPADGALLVVGENQWYNADDFHTYQPDGDSWIIESRDLPEALLAGTTTEHYVFAFIPFDAQSIAPPFEGDGTEASPYLIYTKEQLEMVDYYLSAHFKLMNNINLAGTTYTKAVIASDNDSSTEDFEGTKFTGSFDGNGYTIQNLTINAGTGNYAALFGYMNGATVKNLNLTGTVTGAYRTGAIAGYCGYSSSLINCNAAVAVTGTARVGGLAADCYIATVTNCSATGTVIGTGTEYAGGIAGQFNLSAMTNSYATGNVTGLARVGGLVGNNMASSLESCYATGNVTGTAKDGLYVGGLTGQHHTPATINNCYATGSVTGGDGQDKVGGLVGNCYRTTITNSYATGNVSGSGYGTGGFLGFNQNGTVTGCWSSGNLNVANNSSSTDGDKVGGFVGYNSAATGYPALVTDCYSTGAVVAAGGHIGGFVGYNYGATGYSATISGCYSTGTVVAGGEYVGGFCGRAITNAFISSSYSTGNASGGATEVGGFIGRMSGGSNVENCYATGSATAAGNYAGGFIGGRWGDILANCYSTGTATASSGAGGFNGTGSTAVTNCYWDTETSGLATSTIGTGKTTAEMKTKATFSGWTFPTVWKIHEPVTYPKLSWQAFEVSDLDFDGDIDFADLKAMAYNWLATGSDLTGDIYVDNTVNFRDFAEFAEDWATQ
jgi:hypothetical protein